MGTCKNFYVIADANEFACKPRLFTEESVFSNLQVYDGMTQLGYEKPHHEFRNASYHELFCFI